MTRYHTASLRVGSVGGGVITRDPARLARAIDRFRSALPPVGARGGVTNLSEYRRRPVLTLHLNQERGARCRDVPQERRHEAE